MIKQFLANNFPFLGKPKRILLAIWDTRMTAKSSYSQHGEDVVILDILNKLNVSNGNYVDVGANHPTSISNSYLLYRKGYTGILVEPNPELVKLLMRFRSRDICLPIGCGDSATILPFHISKTPVLSSFSNDINTASTTYLPIMPLDSAIQNIKGFDKIDFLSIDVEGLNLQVLHGAPRTIAKSKVICIEFDDDHEKEEINKIILKTHRLHSELGCNLVFVQKELTF